MGKLTGVDLGMNVRRAISVALKLDSKSASEQTHIPRKIRVTR